MGLPSHPFLFALLLSIAALSACDGGISGTGMPPIDADDSAGEMLESAPGTTVDGAASGDDGGAMTDADAGMDGGNDDGNGGDGDGGGDDDLTSGDSDAGISPESSLLENTMPVRVGPAAVGVVNLTSSNVTLRTGGGQPLIALGADERIDDVALPPATAVLSLSDSTGEIARFDPLALGEGTLTALIVYTRVDGSTAIHSLAGTLPADEANAARIRISSLLAPLPIGEPDEEGGRLLTLTPVDGGTPLTFEQPPPPSQTDYVSVAPGRYTVSADGQDDLPIRLDAGAVATVLASGAYDPTPLVAIDDRQSITVDVTTASGLGVQRLVTGSGASPLASDTVTFDFIGRLEDGTLFASSYAGGQSLTSDVDRLIAGFAEGVQLMTVGSRYRFIVPPALGYGASGSPPAIPPDATLIFEVDLLAIEN